MHLSIDFETASMADLKRVGAWKYAMHPSTRILCMAWSRDGGEPELWLPDKPLPKAFIKAVEAGAEIHAWNAAFERAVWFHQGPRHGFPEVTIESYHCTMARGLFWGLPPRLEQAARVAKLNVGKDIDGHRLMMQVTKPRAFREDGTPRWWTDEDPGKLVRLGQYCQQDVRTEIGVGRTIPAMPMHERQVWLLDQRMNERGLEIDLKLADRLQRLTEYAVAAISFDMAALTGNKVNRTTQAKRLLDYLRSTGLDIKSLNKATLPDVLNDELTEHQRQLIGLWQLGAKTSTAKLKAMSHTRCVDNRIRGLVQYGGAFRTLRWAGRGPQIQNFPRPLKGLDCSWVVHDILAGADSEALGVTYGNPLEVVSSCLRSCFVPSVGHVLAVVDYSGIEARVVAWLADHHDLLDVFRRNEDVYLYTINRLGSDNRQLGKILVLACGYGMGPPKFQATAATFGLSLSLPECHDAVHGWRDANLPIRDMWYDYDRVAREVITDYLYNPVAVSGGRVSFRMARHDGKLAGALLMRLPSGRNIVYRNAHIAPIKVKYKLIDELGIPILGPDGQQLEAVEIQERIAYEGLDLTKKWVKITTWGGKLVENATQAIARDLLADALLRLDALDIPLDTTIHDEVIAEPLQCDAVRTLASMKTIMSVPPLWGTGLPLAAEGKLMSRYGKG